MEIIDRQKINDYPKKFNLEVFVGNLRKNKNIKEVKSFGSQVVQVTLENNVNLCISHRNSDVSKYTAYLTDNNDNLVFDKSLGYRILPKHLKDLNQVYREIFNVSVAYKKSDKLIRKTSV